jgi:hypothetical protein
MFDGCVHALFQALATCPKKARQKPTYFLQFLTALLVDEPSLERSYLKALALECGFFFPNNHGRWRFLRMVNSMLQYFAQLFDESEWKLDSPLFDHHLDPAYYRIPVKSKLVPRDELEHLSPKMKDLLFNRPDPRWLVRVSLAGALFVPVSGRKQRHINIVSNNVSYNVTSEEVNSNIHAQAKTKITVLISDCRQELMVLSPPFPVLDGMLADAPKRQQHYLHFQPFSATYRWFIKGDGSSTELTYFYPFFARTLIIDSVVQPSIVEAHMRNPEATLKRLHLSLSPADQEQLQRRHFTPTQDLQQFSKGCNRDGLRASLVLHTSWAQYTEFVLQRNLLFEEMMQVKLSPRNMP